MKRLLLSSAALLLLAAPAIADDGSRHAGGVYVEGQLGLAIIQDVKTEEYDFGGEIDTVQGTLNYKNTLSLGAELGVNLSENVRLGLSVQSFEAELDTAKLESDLGTDSFTADELSADDIDLDNRVTAYSLNAYYDIDTGGPLVPFVGAGVGFVDIENAKDNELVGNVSAGLRYNINENMYVGAKWTTYFVNGFEDEAGIEYKHSIVHNAAITIGVTF
jgi:opacity protein-like surface antigen